MNIVYVAATVVSDSPAWMTAPKPEVFLQAGEVFGPGRGEGSMECDIGMLKMYMVLDRPGGGMERK